MPANKDIIEDTQAIRDAIRKPEYRQYALFAKKDTIRVRWDDDVALAGDKAIYDALAERGYVQTGTNFKTKTLCYEKND